MLKNFQKYSFSTIYISAFILLLLWLHFFTTKIPIFPEKTSLNTPIFSWIQNWLKHKNFLLKTTIFLLLTTQIIILITTTLKSKLFTTNTFIAGLIYSLLSGYFYSQTFSPILFANIFIISGYAILIKTIPEKKSLLDFCNVAVLFAIASMIFIPYILFFIYMVVAAIIIRSKITKEIIAAIVVFSITYLCYFQILFLINYNFSNIIELLKIIEINKFAGYNSIFEKIYLLIILIYTLIANGHIYKNMGAKNIEKRTIFQLNFTLFIFSAIIYLFTASVGKDLIFTIFIPITIMLSEFFVKLKVEKFTNKLIFLFFIGLPFLFQLLEIYT